MADIVLMPQLGISEESAVLSAWYVKKGDAVKAGQRLFSLETGKASFDFESEYDGFVLELLCAEGDELPIQAPVCVIGAEGEEYAVPGAAEKQPETPAPEPIKEKAEPQPQTEKTEPAVADGEVHASPRAKRLAQRAGIDAASLEPTGPEGRVIERDVRKHLDSGLAAKAVPAIKTKADDKEIAKGGYTDAPVTRIRKIIAENMHASLSNMAQLTLNASFDAGALLAFRKSAKTGVVPGFDKVTLNDLVMFAVSRTILAFPDMNAHFLGDKFRRFSTVNLGFACDTPKGLMVPVIKNTETLSLTELSSRAKELAAACQAGTLSPDDMAEGTFTVTNLGALGITSFTPVINPPQTGILGVNTLETKVRLENGAPQYYTAMGLSLTFDHRAVDGAPAARFLRALCDSLESLALLLAK